MVYLFTNLLAPWGLSCHVLKQQVGCHTTEERRGERSNPATPQTARPSETHANPILETQGTAEDHCLQHSISLRKVSAATWGRSYMTWQATRCESVGHNAAKTNVPRPLLPACFPSFALGQAGGRRTRTTAAEGTDNDNAPTAGTSHIPWVLLYLPMDPPPLRTWRTATYSCSGRLQPETRCRGMIFPRVVSSSRNLQQERGKKSLILDAKQIHIKQLPRPFCKWNVWFRDGEYGAS